MSKTPLRVAAVGDLHYDRHSKGKCAELFSAISSSADIALLCGDLTDYGLPEEAHLLAEDLQSHLKIPALAVVGNHDFESGKIAEVDEILEKTGLQILDGESFTYEDVGFAGVCGFGGGFGPRMLNAWGEPIVKAFVQEAVDHALRLEKALARLETEKKIVFMHYAPIRDTVVGESEEIFPYLGSSRLEGPANRFEARIIFHGHAHNGTLEGRTSVGIPVYNVSHSLLLKSGHERGFFLYEV